MSRLSTEDEASRLLLETGTDFYVTEADATVYGSTTTWYFSNPVVT